MENQSPETTLSPKQQRFCDEYLMDMNAVRAALRAGYSKSTAEGGSLLANAQVQQYIREKQTASSEKMQVTREQIIGELTKIAFSNISNYYDGEGRVKNLQEIGLDARAALSRVDTTVLNGKPGRTRIRLHSKLKALEMLMKYIPISDLPILPDLERQAGLECSSNGKNGSQPEPFDASLYWDEDSGIGMILTNEEEAEDDAFDSISDLTGSISDSKQKAGLSNQPKPYDPSLHWSCPPFRPDTLNREAAMVNVPTEISDKAPVTEAPGTKNENIPILPNPVPAESKSVIDSAASSVGTAATSGENNTTAAQPQAASPQTPSKPAKPPRWASMEEYLEDKRERRYLRSRGIRC